MPEDPCDAHRANQFADEEYRASLRPPDPTAPRDIACKCKTTVRLVLAEDWGTWLVFRGVCVVCGRLHAEHIPKRLLAMEAGQ